MSFRDLAAEVGIKAASVYHYFPTKAELGAALARRYWEDAAATLESLSAGSDPLRALSRYPGIFREALLTGNRMCMCSFMAAEYDDLPDLCARKCEPSPMSTLLWLATTLEDASVVAPSESESRGQAIYAAIAGHNLSRGAVLMFRSTTR